MRLDRKGGTPSYRPWKATLRHRVNPRAEGNRGKSKGGHRKTHDALDFSLSHVDGVVP